MFKHRYEAVQLPKSAEGRSRLIEQLRGRRVKVRDEHLAGGQIEVTGVMASEHGKYTGEYRLNNSSFSSYEDEPGFCESTVQGLSKLMVVA